MGCAQVPSKTERPADIDGHGRRLQSVGVRTSTVKRKRDRAAAGPDRVKRPLVVLVAAALTVLFAIEALVRLSSSALPLPALSYHERMDAHLALMESVVQDGGADIVFLGSSMTGRAWDGALIARSTGLRPYVAALPGSRYSDLNLWWTDHVQPLNPDIVVLEISTVLLEPGQANPGYTDLPAGRQDIIGRLDFAFGTVSEAWRRRRVLREPSTWWGSLDPVRVAITEQRPWGDFGSLEGTNDAEPPSNIRSLDSRHQQEHLVSLVARLSEEGKRVIVTRLSRHPDLLANYIVDGVDTGSLATEAAVTAALAAGAELADSDFPDYPPSNYADLYHVNSEGRDRATSQLLEEFNRLGVRA